MYQAHKSWNEFFNSVAKKEYSEYLNHFLNVEYASYTIYPSRENMFNAFKYTPLDKVKVVIIGQDPYHEPNQAMGLSFSVPKGVKVPPSLINIYKALYLFAYDITGDYGVSLILLSFITFCFISFHHQCVLA